MPAQCSATGMAFGRAGGRELVAAFDGGRVTEWRLAHARLIIAARAPPA